MIPAYRLEWLTDPLAVSGPGCRTAEIARVAIEIPEGRDGFQVDDALKVWRLDEADVPAGTSIAPRAFHAWLAPKVDKLLSGPVKSLPDDDAALPAVIAAFEEELAGANLRAPVTPGAPLSAFSTQDIEWSFLVTRACRSYALPREIVLARLLPLSPFTEDVARAIVEAAYVSGFGKPRVEADRIIEETNHARALVEREAKAKAGAAIRAATRFPRIGLVKLTRTAPEDEHHRLEHRLGLGGPLPSGVSYYLLGGLPGFNGTLLPGLTIETGTYDLTDAEFRECLPISGSLAALIGDYRLAASDGRRFSESDFAGGSVQTIEGSFAREHALTVARQLLRASQTGDTSDACAYAEKCFLTLAVAFGGRLSLLNVADVIGDVLTERANERRTSTQDYDNHGARLPAVFSPADWSGLIKPATVGPRMLAALAEGSVWTWGELMTDPTTEDRRRIARELDPNILVRAIAKITGSRNEVRTEALYEELHQAEVTATATPNSGIRKAISEALRSLRFEKVEVTDPAGQRRRAWLRNPADPTTASTALPPPSTEAELGTVGDLE